MTKQQGVVGAWRVKTEGAPFAYHMFAFHSDGTMQQSNPPAGNTETSDSAGLGVWAEKDGVVKARFEEYRVAFEGGEVTRGTIDFTIHVEGDRMHGMCCFNIYDPDGGKLLHGPLAATLAGTRISLDG
jgi:hypothetical protein